MGRNDDRLGPRFPDMTNVYDPALRKLALDTAEELGIPLQRGVFALFNGPCYETAAEIRAYRILGADAIGMSLVPEATAARYLGMHVLGISCITNMATGIAVKEHSHEAVLAAAEKAARHSTGCLPKYCFVFLSKMLSVRPKAFFHFLPRNCRISCRLSSISR